MHENPQTKQTINMKTPITNNKQSNRSAQMNEIIKIGRPTQNMHFPIEMAQAFVSPSCLSVRALFSCCIN